MIALAIGIAETFTGFFSSSIALVADGLHSFATATVFLIVWVGLRLSERAPDGMFHFGYYRFETLGSLVAAFLIAVFGGVIAYESYLEWIQPKALTQPLLALVVALASAAIAAVVTAKIRRTSKQYGSTSLKTGALNGAIDSASAVAVVASILLNGYFGILHADAVAGLLIAAAVFPVAYSIMRESSLVLVDACNCGDVGKAIAQVARSVGGVMEAHSLRLRRLGPFLTGDIHIVVSGDMLVRDADLIATQVEEKIKHEFADVIEFKIRIESDEREKQSAKKESR